MYWVGIAEAGTYWRESTSGEDSDKSCPNKTVTPVGTVLTRARDWIVPINTIMSSGDGLPSY